MAWVEDELRRQLEERTAEQKRLAQEAAQREKDTRQKALDREAAIARAQQENETEVVRLKQMLDDRDVPQLLKDVQRHLGGEIIFKDRKVSYSDRQWTVAAGAYGLVRINQGTTHHEEGRGRTLKGRRSSGEGMNSFTDVETYYPPFNYDATPFDISVLSIGLRSEKSFGREKINFFHLAESGSFIRKIEYPTPSLFEQLKSLVGVRPIDTPTARFVRQSGKISLDGEMLSHSVDSPTNDPRFVTTGKINPVIAELYTRHIDAFEPTTDIQADIEGIKGLLVDDLRKIGV